VFHQMEGKGQGNNATRRGQEMNTNGSLWDEIERKSAEIHSWPTWAQPFRPDSPRADTDTTQSTPGAEQPVADEPPRTR
jgi:hypothetical protein